MAGTRAAVRRAEEGSEACWASPAIALTSAPRGQRCCPAEGHSLVRSLELSWLASQPLGETQGDGWQQTAPSSRVRPQPPQSSCWASEKLPQVTRAQWQLRVTPRGSNRGGWVPGGTATAAGGCSRGNWGARSPRAPVPASVRGYTHRPETRTHAGTRPLHSYTHTRHTQSRAESSPNARHPPPAPGPARPGGEGPGPGRTPTPCASSLP